MAQLSDTTLINDANLIAYYKLENTSDSKGSRTLTNNGSTPFNPAKYNNGADGGSSNSTKYLANTSDNYGITGGACSLVGWFNLTTAPGTNTSQILINLGDGTTNFVSFQIKYSDVSSTKQIYMGRTRDNVADDGITVNQVVATGAFHHYAMTYDGTNQKAYFDGVQIGSTTSSTGNGVAAGATGLGILASIGGSAGTFSSGIIDDVAVFSRALTLSEVQLLFNPVVSGGGDVGYSFMM